MATGRRHLRVVSQKRGWRRTSRPGPPRPTQTPSTSRVISLTADACSSTPATAWPAGRPTSKDVYEYEPEGVGPGNASAARRRRPAVRCTGPNTNKSKSKARAASEGAGCVALISSGTSGEESAFMEASQTGSDVFFITHAHLVPGTIENGVACMTPTNAPPPALHPRNRNPALVQERGRLPRGPRDPNPRIYGAPVLGHLPRPRQPHPRTTRRQRHPRKRRPPRRSEPRSCKKALKACHKDKRKKKRQSCEKRGAQGIRRQDKREEVNQGEREKEEMMSPRPALRSRPRPGLPDQLHLDAHVRASRPRPVGGEGWTHPAEAASTRQRAIA